MKRLTLAIVVLFAVQPAVACTFTLRQTISPEGMRFEWDAVPGATSYQVFEHNLTYGRSRTLPYEAGGERSFFVARPSSTSNHVNEYFVIARRGHDDSFGCVGTASMDFKGDTEMANLTHKRIVPLVGSTRGANGADFRTELTLHPWPLAHGRIVFRPTGTVASDSDPFLRYQFGDNGSAEFHPLHFDDVVAAMGATGTGTLEIIPDANSKTIVVPEMEVRVYNVTPGGTFGSFVPAVRPAEWFQNPATQRSSVNLTILPVTGDYRRNAGFRTLTAVRYMVWVDEPGAERWKSEIREAPAAFTMFGSIDSIAGVAVSPAATVYVIFTEGYAISFRTETENSTNDPTLILSDPVDATALLPWAFQ